MDAEHQVDHLALLVGGNALPNAVAGILLGARGAAISLIYTKATEPVARRLKTWLEAQGRGFTVKMVPQVKESEPASIFQGVTAALSGVSVSRVGLNYTGGTKAMSVHAYRAAEKWAVQNRVRCQFSYLDARTLKMRFDPPDPETGQLGQEEYVALEHSFRLDDLLVLHGWATVNPPSTRPMFPQSAEALAFANANDASTQAWLDWKKTELKAKCGDGREEWKSNKELRRVALRFPQNPALSDLVRALQSDLQQTGPNLDLGRAGAVSGVAGPRDLCCWLHGNWLEHHVLASLQGLSPQKYSLSASVHSVKTKAPVDFEVDVLAMRGYQLFAFSCGTDSKRGPLKVKLFEAFVRARQLGGDEARVALVCTSKAPQILEGDMRRDLDVGGQIRVFGRPHLSDLKAHLGQWVQEQSR